MSQPIFVKLNEIIQFIAGFVFGFDGESIWTEGSQENGMKALFYVFVDDLCGVLQG